MTIDAVPLTKLLGSTVDIIPLLRFHFWPPVYYHQSETSFPSDSKEGLGNIVGISKHCGHALTYMVLTADTGHVIYRSLLRPDTTGDANLRASMFVGEKDTHNEILKSRDYFSNINNMDEYKLADTPLPSPVFNPQDLIGRSFLMDEQPDGQKARGKMVQLIEDHESSLEDNPTRIQFRVSVNNDKAEEIITYNKMLEYITRHEESDVMWKFQRIISHEVQAPKTTLLIEWENGEITKEPLSIIAVEDPVTCTIHARENGLLNQPGWKRFKHIAKNEKKFTRMVNQAKLKSFHTAPK
jgi:hypothetical protein